MTITKFLVEPLEHIARAIGKALQALLEEIPVKVWPFFFVTLFIISFLVYLSVFRIRLRIYPFFTLEPASTSGHLAVAAVPAANQPASPTVAPIEDVPRQVRKVQVKYFKNRLSYSKFTYSKSTCMECIYNVCSKLLFHVLPSQALFDVHLQNCALYLALFINRNLLQYFSQ